MNEKITNLDLALAFKILDDIEAPTVASSRPLFESCGVASKTEALVEDYYDISSKSDIEEAKADREAEIAQVKLDKIEKIVDLDADSPEDLQPSYVGKTIVQCPQCMTLFYKDPADVIPSEDNPEIVNVAEVCQHCGNDFGYTVVGKVEAETPAEPNLDEIPDAAEETEVNEFDLDFEEPAGEPVEEPQSEEFAEEKQEEVEEALTETTDAESEETSEETPVEEEPAEEPSVDEPVLFTKEEVKDVAIDVATDVGEKMEEDPTQDVDVPAIADEKIADKIEEITADSEEMPGSEVEATDETEKEEVSAEESEEPAESLTEALNEEAELKVTDQAIDAMLDSSEFKKPISEKEVEGYFDEACGKKEKTFEWVDSLEDVKDEAIEKCISKSLTSVYENVSGFSLTSCELTEDNFIVEGVIKFASGNEKPTKYVFDEAVAEPNKLTLRGVNENFANGEFALVCAIEDNGATLLAEELSYKYSIKGSLVEGLAK